VESQKIYILFYKPYGVLSQFTKEHGHQALCDYGPFPKNIYPAGRLDVDSEGLLLLTNDNTTKHFFTSPAFEHPKTYLVQVEGIPQTSDLSKLEKGVLIDGKRTRPSTVRLLEQEPMVPPRSIPIRFRKSIPTSWIEIIIHEGRNRQIRKMTASIGFPTLRILRTAITYLTLNGLKPGDHRQLSTDEIAELTTYLSSQS
jgi:23S rRNA pseudouridine2457 synthase